VWGDRPRADRPVAGPARGSVEILAGSGRSHDSDRFFRTGCNRQEYPPSAFGSSIPSTEWMTLGSPHMTLSKRWRTP
jgi:hypothetical protein